MTEFDIGLIYGIVITLGVCGGLVGLVCAYIHSEAKRAAWRQAMRERHLARHLEEQNPPGREFIHRN
jgi:hypothetical protein